MSYWDDNTYDEAVGPCRSLGTDTLWLDESSHADDLLIGTILDTVTYEDHEGGDTFTEQLAAELDSDMAAAMFNDAFGDDLADAA